MKNGLFITFEGADGCGKTTQIELLDKYLKDKGLETLITREPGAKGLGVKLREILLNYEGEVSPKASTVAYQGYGRELDIVQINYLNNLATGGLKPDLTIIFDIDVETSMQRVGKNKDRMESAGVEFFNRVRCGYLEIAKQEPQRVKVINASDTIENIHNQVVELVNKL